MVKYWSRNKRVTKTERKKEVIEKKSSPIIMGQWLNKNPRCRLPIPTVSNLLYRCLVKNTSTLNFTCTVHKLHQIKPNTTTLHKLHNTKSFILYFDSYHALITSDVIISRPRKCFGDGMEGKMRKNFLFSPSPLPSCLFFALTPTLLMNSCAGYVITNTKIY